MQAISKLLNKYDSNKAKFSVVRLKYDEVMFQVIVKDPDTTIAPVTFIEDIIHRFQNIRWSSRADFRMVPGITLDLLVAINEFTQPRYEPYLISTLNETVHDEAIRNGCMLLLARAAVLTSSRIMLDSKDDLTVRVAVFYYFVYVRPPFTLLPSRRIENGF